MMLFKLFLVISPRENEKFNKIKHLIMELTGKQYPRKCVFRIFGEDRIKQFNIQQGEDITVQFDIDAHEYNGRWFNEIRAYNVTRGQVQPTPAPGATPFPPAGGATAPFPPAQEPASEGSADDLPF